MDQRNIEDLCRICAGDSNFFKSIYDQVVLGRRLYELINDLCQVNVYPGDGLPEFVCSLCQWQLLEFQRFKDKTVEGQATLISIKMHMDQVRIKEEPLDIEDDGVDSAEFPEPLDKVATKLGDEEEAEEILPDGGTVSCVADRIPKVEIVESIDYKAFIEIQQATENCEEIVDAVPSLTACIKNNQLPEEDHWRDDMDSADDGSLPCTSTLTSEECGMPCSELLKLSKVSHPLLLKPCRKTRGRVPSVEASPSKQARLEARRSKARLRREQETPEQHKKRLKQLSDVQMRRIARESPEERAVRLHRLRVNKEAYMVVESPVQREVRLQKMRLSQSKRLAKESPEKREERLLQLKLNQVKRRAGIAEGNQRRARGLSSMEGPQCWEGIPPGGNLDLRCSDDEADVSRVEAKASKRLSKGSCEYNEELLGIPPEFLSTLEEILGPEEEVKVSVERKRRSKCRSRKNFADDPVKQAREANEVTMDLSLESPLEKYPAKATSAESESCARKNRGSISMGAVKDIAGLNELVDCGSQPVCAVQSAENQVSNPLQTGVSSERMDSSSQDEEQLTRNCSLGFFPDLSGINEPLSIISEPSETRECLTSLNCGKGPSSACLPPDKDLLGLTEKELANIQSPVHASDEVLMQTQICSVSGMDDVNGRRKQSRPRRSSCRRVNYSEDAVVENGIGEVSDTAKDHIIGKPDAVPKQRFRQGKLKENGGCGAFSSVGNIEVSGVVEKQVVGGPDRKQKQQASPRKRKKKGSSDESVSESSSEILDTMGNPALKGPKSKLKQPASQKKVWKKRVSYAVVSDYKGEVLEIAETQADCVPTLNSKQGTSQSKSRKKENAASFEDNSTVSDTISGLKIHLRLRPPASQKKSKRKPCRQNPNVEEENSPSKSHTLIVTAFSCPEALDVRNSVSSPNHSKAHDTELDVSGGVLESIDGEIKSTDDTAAKLMHSNDKVLESIPADDAIESSIFDTPSDVPVPCGLNGPTVGSVSSSYESAADIEKVIEMIPPGEVGSGGELSSPVDVEIHAVVPIVDTRCAKSYSSPSSSQEHPRSLPISGNENELNVSNVSSGIDNIVDSRKPLSDVGNETSLPSWENNSLQLKLSIGHRKETFESLDKAFDMSADGVASDSRVSLASLLPLEGMQSDMCCGEELDTLDRVDITKDINNFLDSLEMGNAEVRNVDRGTPDQQCTEESGVPS